jgi:hypothetical protein
MTSLVTKHALDALPAEIRDHIKVESETLYGITLSMTIDTLEALVNGSWLIGRVTELEREADAAEQAAEEAEEEVADAQHALAISGKRVDALSSALEDAIAALDYEGLHNAANAARAVLKP